MHRAMVALAMALIMGTSAQAQLGGLLGRSLGLPKTGEVGGTYQSHDRVRTFITSEAYRDDHPYDKIVAKAADMAAARGFPRIGVTRTGCTTAMVGGSPRWTSCFLTAVMLNERDQAEPQGDQPVRYYDVKDVRTGMMAPPGPK